MERRRIILSGSGGQGVITAAIILAETAILYEGLNAVQSQAYGPEARGGASRSDVIISDTDILFPKVVQPNILVCLTQEAYDKFSGLIRPGGFLLTDSHYVKQNEKIDARQIELDMYTEVMNKIGKPIVFNICVLGVLITFIKLVNPKSIMKVLETRIPPSFLQFNRDALDLGIKMAENYSAKVAG
ncbi:MAG: 2-oxoacid:acceptor oxidoreductase family protein [Syntrophobacterales bacterium]|nr:2-oxoacid:acceptor oxidoreductase family protein [Syntrophobacterales bacterium]